MATVLASVGIIFAALITYLVGARNRSQLERHHEASHTLDVTQALRGRFTTIATQLADPATTIRTAAVSALEALADDWIDRGKPREAQACVNVLCDYLRTPYEPSIRDRHLRSQTRRIHRTKADYTDTTLEYPHDDLDTRHAIVRIMAAHLKFGHDHSWSHFSYDFNGAYLHNANFSHAMFDGEQTSFSGARFGGEYTSFYSAVFSAGTTFNDATFGGEKTSFEAATFSSYTWFVNAVFTGDETWFRDAVFSGSRTAFTGAKFGGKYTSFVDATFSASTTWFEAVTFSGETTWFSNAKFRSRNTWFDGATFSGRRISFEGAKFSSDRTSFGGAIFSGDNIMFSNPGAWVNVEVDWKLHACSDFGPLRPQPQAIRPEHWPPAVAP